MSELDPIIKIEDLSKSFTGTTGEVIEVLKDINLEIYRGDIFGIIGMSGAGKSTLVRCINFLEKPDAGKVLFDGKDLSSLSDKELYRVRQSMGMIFQQFNLLMQRTALDNVCFPLEIAGIRKKEAREKARGLLELVGIPDKLQAYPSQLSGGQRQQLPEPLPQTQKFCSAMRPPALLTLLPPGVFWNFSVTSISALASPL